MKILDQHLPRIESRLVRLQFLCLLIAGILEFLGVAFAHELAYQLLYYVLPVLVFVFCITAIMQRYKTKTKYSLWLPIAMAVWFLILPLFPQVNQIQFHHYGLFLCVYLFAFPFARVTEDGKQQFGLKVIAAFYVVAALALICYTVILLLDCVPGFLQNNIYWDGPRLRALLHPNTTARLFMIGIACAFGACVFIADKRIKALLLVAAALMFFAQALTNSRAAILMTCVLVAGTVFFGLFNGKLKRFFLGAAAGLAVMVVLYLAAQGIFQWNENRLAASAAVQSEPAQQIYVDTRPQQVSGGIVLLSNRASVEPLSTQAPPPPASPQDSLLQDLPTLNSRTKIWSSVFRAIREDPSILLYGTNHIDEIVGSVNHTHNAWLELLLYLGLPALILSLCFTALAVWTSARLLLVVQVTLDKKIVAMLLLCLLVTSLVEPSLFFTNKKWHFVDFFFFLSLGYAIEWKKQLPKIKFPVSED